MGPSSCRRSGNLGQTTTKSWKIGCSESQEIMSDREKDQLDGKVVPLRSVVEPTVILACDHPMVPQPHGGALRPFVKGQSGNPSGKPKTKPITDAYAKILAMTRTELASWKPRTAAEKLAWAMITKAWSEKDRLSVAAAKEVTDRMEGTVTQKVQVGRLEFENLTDEELDLEIRRLEEGLKSDPTVPAPALPPV